jgi:hypothetical protein
MLATELLFVYVHCLVDDAIKASALSIPRRPGPAPACTDAELLTIALVRHLLGRRSENGFVAEVRRDWPPLFPHLPDQRRSTPDPLAAGRLRAAPGCLRGRRSARSGPADRYKCCDLHCLTELGASRPDAAQPCPGHPRSG